MTAVTAHRLRLGPVTLHVEERPGGGAPVLVLHGFTGSARAMAPVVDALEAAGRATLAPDLLGHGHSTVDGPADAHTMDACVDQLRAALDTLGAGRVHVVGYSMGGRVALSLAAAGPTRLRSLCVIGASPGLADAADRAERRRADDELAAAVLTGGVEAFVERWTALPLFATQRDRLGPGEREAVRRQRLANDARGLAASLRGMGTGSMPPLHDHLGRIDVPTLVLAGADDARYCAIGRAMATELPAATFVDVADAGHAAHLENPAAVTAAITSFLDRVDPL